jgi:hypothetical protein
MKSNKKIAVYSERVLRNEELLSLRGGVKVPVDGCGGKKCTSAQNCCKENPVCGTAPGNPDFMICMSP